MNDNKVRLFFETGLFKILYLSDKQLDQLIKAKKDNGVFQCTHRWVDAGKEVDQFCVIDTDRVLYFETVRGE